MDRGGSRTSWLWLRQSTLEAHQWIWVSSARLPLERSHLAAYRCIQRTVFRLQGTLTYQDKMDSKALTWKYGSSKSLRYMERPSCCHSNVRQLFPALARSHRIGRANCFRGELVVITRLRHGMIPAWAASSCLDLFSRQRL